MELIVRRSWPSKFATVGVLFVDGEMECFTLEDVVREVKGQPVASWKVQDRTAIPEGRYPVTVDYSAHFGCDMAHVLNVPGFEGIRIHWGNKAADTDGCVLLGDVRQVDWVGDSRKAYLRWFPRLQAAIAAEEEVWITLRPPVPGE